MNFLTRAQLIQQNRWKTGTVQTPEQGEIRIARPDAANALHFRDLQRRKEEGETLEAESMAFMLYATVIDEKGEAVFFDTKDARRLLSAISPETLTALMQAAGRLTTSDEGAPAPGVDAAGKSGA